MKGDKDNIIIDAKLKLYRIILRIPNNELTENDIEIAYHLSVDQDVKNHLKKALKEERAWVYMIEWKS